MGEICENRVDGASVGNRVSSAESSAARPSLVVADPKGVDELTSSGSRLRSSVSAPPRVLLRRVPLPWRLVFICVFSRPADVLTATSVS